MSKISETLLHTKETYIYSLGYAIERSSFYGIRGLIVLYLVSEKFQFSDVKAFKVYGFVTASILITNIIGGIIGDLFIGNKRTVIFGAILQFIGALMLCMSSTISLYFALGLYALGSGFYSTNIRSLFSKIYLDKIKLADGGFTILYFATNLGAFLGTTIVVELGMINFKYGFFLAGFLMIVSGILIYYTRGNQQIVDIIIKQIKDLNLNKRVLYIVAAIIISTTFSILYDISHEIEIDSQIMFMNIKSLPLKGFILVIPSILSIILSVVLGIIWSKYYFDHFIKISIGFLLVSCAYILAPIYIGNVTVDKLGLLLISLLLINLAEVFIWPSVNSAITKYSNPKYLATVFGLVSIPAFLLSGVGRELYYLGDNNQIIKMISGFSISLIIGLLLLIFRKKYKNNYLQQGV